MEIENRSILILKPIKTSMRSTSSWTSIKMERPLPKIIWLMNIQSLIQSLSFKFKINKLMILRMI